MLLCRAIGLLALVAVLLHATAVVRHSLFMATQHASEQALVADLGVICHADQSGDSSATDTAPASPAQSPASTCPICAGLTAAFVLAGNPAHLLPPVRGPPLRVSLLPDTLVPASATALLPPVRGPPAV
jgi:hypothetical protein